MASYRKNLLRCILKEGISTWRTYNCTQKNNALKDFMYPSSVEVIIKKSNEELIDNKVDTESNGLNTDINESKTNKGSESNTNEGNESDKDNDLDEIISLQG